MFLLLLIALAIFLRVFPLEMQKRIVNEVIPRGDLQNLLLYCGYYIVAVVLAGVLKYLINVLQGYIGQKILYEMRRDLYAKILTLPLPFFRRTQPGTVIASLTSELNTIGDFIGGALTVPVTNFLSLAALGAYMAYLNPLLALLSFAIYPVEIAIIPLLQRRFNRLNQERIGLTRNLSSAIGEAISGISEIHCNAGYPIENRKLAHLSNSLSQLRHRMNLVKYLIKFGNNFFQSLGPFTLFLVGGYLTAQGRLSLGALVAFLSAYEKLYDPWKELMDYYQDYQDSRVKYNQIVEYFDLRSDFEIVPPDGRDPYQLDGQVTVQDVSLEFEGRVKILDQVSLDIPKGGQVALVGPSGSGKTSLAMVIGQLYDYTRGHVYLDGLELKALSKLDVSRNVGYVSQHPFIFNGSIRENLLYAVCSLQELQSQEQCLPPDRDTILRVVHDVGLSDDVLRIGLTSLLSQDTHREFAGMLVRVRHAFHVRWKKEFRDVIDFIDIERFQYHASLGENIVFGYPSASDEWLTRGGTMGYLVRLLDEIELREPLIHFGIELASRTVSLLEGLEHDAFFFEMSPIAREEFDRFRAIIERVERAEIGRDDAEDLLRLALRFIPAQHKMSALPLPLENRILAARPYIMEKLAKHHPGAFTFFDADEYLYTQSVLSNVLFGHLKVEHPHAMETVRKRVVDLIREWDLLDELMEVGLEFQVGSKGDRLSGGQRQKIALARALLKNPSILILDEATASMDNMSQGQVQYLINTQLKGKCTLISVMHRLEMLVGYDQIAVLKAGKITEKGNYQELMEKRGLFYELARGHEI